MCKLCENKLAYAHIDDGWIYIMCDNCNRQDTAELPVTFCPWCGEKLNGKERMMPKVTPRDWKYQMQDQEVENEQI